MQPRTSGTHFTVTDHETRGTGRASFTVRGMQAGEVDVLYAIFDGLSPTSRTRRFLMPMPRLSTSTVTALANVDGTRRVAFVAHPVTQPVTQDVAPTASPIGIGRYVATGPSTAEVAIAVVDAWHGRGVGSALLRRLGLAASAAGIGTFEGCTLVDNGAAKALLRSCPRARTTAEGAGVMAFTAPVQPRGGG